MLKFNAYSYEFGHNKFGQNHQDVLHKSVQIIDTYSEFSINTMQTASDTVSIVEESQPPQSFVIIF